MFEPNRMALPAFAFAAPPELANDRIASDHALEFPRQPAFIQRKKGNGARRRYIDEVNYRRGVVAWPIVLRP